MPKQSNKPIGDEGSSQTKTGSRMKPKQPTPTTAEKVEAEVGTLSSAVKELEAVYLQTGYPKWIIRFKGGGEVPKVLSGSYTRKAIAEAAIEDYLATRKK